MQFLLHICAFMILGILGLGFFPPSVHASIQESRPVLDLSTMNLQENTFRKDTPAPTMHKLEKKMYRSDEDVTVTITDYEDEDLKVAVFDSQGKKTNVTVDEVKKVHDTTFTISPRTEFAPGKYKIVITDAQGHKIEQDFSWGVLALNTDRSMYVPGQTATIAMAVLDDAGDMVCDANISLEITHPNPPLSGRESESSSPDKGRLGGVKETLSTDNGKITVNKEQCSSHAFSLEPDYQATYNVGEKGIYQLHLTAKTKNGEWTITDSFEVREQVAFDVERVSATRIYPPNIYPMQFTITANQDFNGVITETVPDSFKIIQTGDEDSYDKTQTLYLDKKQDPSMALESSVLGASTSALALPFADSYPITQGFGVQMTEPLLQDLYKRFGIAGHDGIDFGLPVGTSVHSVDDGKVLLADTKGDYGVTVIIEHTWGRTYYGHLNTLKVNNGDVVTKGMEIALSGNTGESTGPHLHFGMKPNAPDMGNSYYGKVDPLPYLGLSESQVLAEDVHSVLGIQTTAETSSPSANLLEKQNVASAEASFESALRAEILEQEMTKNDKVKILKWHVNLKKGETIKLGYQYKTPNISPQFYLVGPLRFYDTDKDTVTFQELRQWQLANDRVAIDSLIHATGQNYMNFQPMTVFTTDLIGYTFYKDSDGTAVYAKTTDAGATWGTPVVVNSSTTILNPVIWFDQWTPGDTGTTIHIIMKDSAGSDDLFYRTLETAGGADTLGTLTNITTSLAPTNSWGTTPNKQRIGITKSTDGSLYVSIESTSPETSFIIKCSTTCTTSTNWSDISPTMAGDEETDHFLLPLPSGDIMDVIMWSPAGSGEWQTYTAATGTWSSRSQFEVDLGFNSTFEAYISATLDRQSGRIYIAYVAENTSISANTGDIRTVMYDPSTRTWTAKTNIITDSGGAGDASCVGVANCGLGHVKLAFDENTGDIYAIYSAQSTAGTANTAKVYWRKSTDGMITWSSETALSTDAVTTIIGLQVNMMSNERIYASWQDDAASAVLYGDTVADLTLTALNDRMMRHSSTFKTGIEEPYQF